MYIDRRQKAKARKSFRGSKAVRETRNGSCFYIKLPRNRRRSSPQIIRPFRVSYFWVLFFADRRKSRPFPCSIRLNDNCRALISLRFAGENLFTLRRLPIGKIDVKRKWKCIIFSFFSPQGATQNESTCTKAISFLSWTGSISDGLLYKFFLVKFMYANWFKSSRTCWGKSYRWFYSVRVFKFYYTKPVGS